MSNAVVSGGFILIENVYLVGDLIEGGGAEGAVGVLEIHTTRTRDADGRLHIIRNGDMKQVVNYSKELEVISRPVSTAVGPRRLRRRQTNRLVLNMAYGHVEHQTARLPCLARRWPPSLRNRP